MDTTKVALTLRLWRSSCLPVARSTGHAGVAITAGAAGAALSTPGSRESPGPTGAGRRYTKIPRIKAPREMGRPRRVPIVPAMLVHVMVPFKLSTYKTKRASELVQKRDKKRGGAEDTKIRHSRRMESTFLTLELQKVEGACLNGQVVDAFDANGRTHRRKGGRPSSGADRMPWSSVGNG